MDDGRQRGCNCLWGEGSKRTGRPVSYPPGALSCREHLNLKSLPVILGSDGG